MAGVATPGPLLILTMPGFGVETLRHLVRWPRWPSLDVIVALIGARPPAWRFAAARLRRNCMRPEDRIHLLADATVCSRTAERWLGEIGWPPQWLADDGQVRRLRLAMRPALTLTLTSRILFSARTLQEPGGDWLNVHPGLLPEYAGAAPGPYMFFDGVGGITIHHMALKVDAGAIVDRAPNAEPLGDDVGEYFFGRLPAHTAARLQSLLGGWLDSGKLPAAPAAQAGPLHHCTSARLAADRQLDWRLAPHRSVRWVRSLAALAPAWWLDGQRRVEVMDAAAVRESGCAAEPGVVVRVDGRWIDVGCGDGVVALRCRSRPGVAVGQLLGGRPAVAGAP